MDANNLAAQQPVAPINTLPQQPEANNSKRVILWFVIGLIVIVVIVGSVYLFLSKQTTSSQPQTNTTQTSETPAAEENLENDLNNINAEESASNDFSSIDQDLQQL